MFFLLIATYLKFGRDFIKKERGSEVVPEQNKLSNFALKINSNNKK